MLPAILFGVKEKNKPLREGRTKNNTPGEVSRPAPAGHTSPRQSPQKPPAPAGGYGKEKKQHSQERVRAKRKAIKNPKATSLPSLFLTCCGLLFILLRTLFSPGEYHFYYYSSNKSYRFYYGFRAFLHLQQI